LTASSSNSARRPANTTLYPSSTSASATAFPIPVPAPVTMAILAGPPLPPSAVAAEAVLLVVISHEHDHWLAVGANVAAPHARGVERHHQVAVRVEADDTAFAANRLQLVLDDRVGRRLNRHHLIPDLRADLVR